MCGTVMHYVEGGYQCRGCGFFHPVPGSSTRVGMTCPASGVGDDEGYGGEA